MTKLLSTDFTQVFFHELTVLPFDFLQGAAVVGVFAVLLLLWGTKMPLIAGSKPTLTIGLVTGLSCFILSFLLSSYMREGPLKPSAGVVEFLFIAGVAGGWRNALMAFAFAWLARYSFGGSENILAGGLNLLPFTLSGAIAHSVILRDNLYNLSLPNLGKLIAWRFFFTEAFAALLWATGVVTPEVSTVIMVKRLLSSVTTAAFTLFSVMVLLRQAVTREQVMYMDQSCGLPNRRALQLYIEELLTDKKNDAPRPHTLVLVTVSNLQQLTQTHGHNWVDIFSRQCAEALRSYAQKTAVSVCKPLLFVFSESSLAVMLCNATTAYVQDNGLAQSLFGELLSTFRGSKLTLQPGFRVSVMGVDPAEVADSVHFLRSIALIEQQTSAEVQFFEANLNQQVLLEEQIRATIARWITENTVPLWLQPQVNLGNNTCYGAEALLRMHRDDDAMLYTNPNLILNIAEKHGIRDELEWAVVCTTVSYFQKLPPHLAHLKLSCNLTPEMFSRPDFARKLINLMRKKNINPKRLVLEIIETHKFSISPVVQENIMLLTNNGFCLSLDDFGTGYSTIALLSQYHFKELKLDYSLVSNSSNPRVYSAIKLAMQSAKKYQAGVVAEGIETRERKKQMHSLGAEYGQGYLFGKAMPLERFIAFASASPEERGTE